MTFAGADGLTFDEAAHAYALDGSPVPGVTSVLARLSDYGHVPANILAEAAARGRAVHEAIELDIAADLDESALHPEIAARLAHWRTFARALRFKPLASELRVVSRRYGYAGTLDLYGELAGVPCVVDIKATAIIPSTVGLQTAAYAQALKETLRCGPVRRGVLHLQRERWQYVPATRVLDLPEFLAELDHYKATTP